MKHPFFLIRFGKRSDDKLPVKKNTERKKKQKKKERKKNTDRKQTKLNALHVMYNIKILLQ